LRPSSFVGGPERQLLHYAELDRAGLTETILGTFVGVHEGREFLEAAEEHGFQTLALPTGSLGDYRATFALMRFLKEREISLLCTHGYQADILGGIAGLARRVPVACFLLGWTGEDWKVRVYELADRAFLPLAKRIVCLSQTHASRLARYRVLRPKLRVVLGAVESCSIGEDQRLRLRQEVRARLGLPANCMIVASAGRLSPEKGTVFLLRAVPELQRQFRDARFVIFGRGRLRGQLEGMTKRLGVSAAVLFAGHVPDFPLLLPGIDVLVNPSLTEQMPNVVLEAMAAAVPVVATAVGAVKEIAGDGNTLVSVPPADAAAIVRAVRDLLLDAALAGAIGRAGQKRVQEAFSFARQGMQLRALYEELIPALAPVRATPGTSSRGGH
jgi:glycosyltransferase involved in cell wall biosynthesis